MRPSPRPARFLEVPEEDCDIAVLFIAGHRTTLPTWKGSYVIIWHDGRYYIDPDETAQRRWHDAYGKEWVAGLVKEKP